MTSLLLPSLPRDKPYCSLNTQVLLSIPCWGLCPSQNYWPFRIETSLNCQTGRYLPYTRRNTDAFHPDKNYSYNKGCCRIYSLSRYLRMVLHPRKASVFVNRPFEFGKYRHLQEMSGLRNVFGPGVVLITVRSAIIDGIPPKCIEQPRFDGKMLVQVKVCRNSDLAARRHP